MIVFAALNCNVSPMALADALRRPTGVVHPCLWHKPEVAFAEGVGLEASYITPEGCESGESLSLGSTAPCIASAGGPPCFRRSSQYGFTIVIISPNFWPLQRGQLSPGLHGGGGGVEGLTPDSPPSSAC